MNNSTETSMHHITWYRLIYLIAGMFGVGVFVLSCTVAYFVGYEASASDHAIEAMAISIDEYEDAMEAAEIFEDDDYDELEPEEFADLGETPWEATDQQFGCDDDLGTDGWDEPVYWDAPHPNAKVLESGVAILNLDAPTRGDVPKGMDKVVIDWRGWTTDGKLLDDSYDRDWKTEFSLTSFIPGFSEAIQNMHEGEWVRVWIPAELAYKNAPGKPQGMLIFDIELHEVKTTYTGCKYGRR